MVTSLVARLLVDSLEVLQLDEEQDDGRVVLRNVRTAHQVLLEHPAVAQQGEPVGRRDGQRSGEAVELSDHVVWQRIGNRVVQALRHAGLVPADLLHEQLHDLRIELGARFGDELGARIVERQRRAVRALGRHGVVGLQDGERPRRRGDAPPGKPVGVAPPIEALVVEEHGGRDIAEGRDLADHVEAEPRMQLDRRPLVGPQGAWLHKRLARQREVARVAQQRRADEDILLLLVEAEIARERGGVERERGGMALPLRIARCQRLEQRADRRVVRLDDLGTKLAVMQHGTGLIAEREQHVVVDVLESAGTVDAHDHAAEAVVHVDRDGDERLDLPVGGRQAVDLRRRLILPHDLIEGQHLPCEPLRDHARRRIVVEALRDRDVEGTVLVDVLSREEHPLLRPDELDGRLEDQRSHIVTPCPMATGLVQPLQLRPQLAVPLTLDLPRLRDAAQQVALAACRILRPPQLPPEILLLGTLPLDLAPSTCEADGRGRRQRDGDRASRSVPSRGHDERRSNYTCTTDSNAGTGPASSNSWRSCIHRWERSYISAV
jgi:hypothetical protein